MRLRLLILATLILAFTMRTGKVDPPPVETPTVKTIDPPFIPDPDNIDPIDDISDP